MEQESFNFQNITEIPDNPDFGKMRLCPHCGKSIPVDAVICLYCGKTASLLRTRPKWLIITAVMLILAFLALLFF